MKSSAVLLALVAANLANPCSSQELPEFDEGDFQIVSIEPGSKALVRSDGRDFYCSLVDKDGWYVAVIGCQPFVSIFEAAKADEVILKIELDALAKEAQAEAAAAAIRAEEDRARRVAQESAKKEKEARKKELVAGLTVEDFSLAIESIALRNGCTLEIGFNAFDDSKHLDPLLLELKISVGIPSEKRAALIQLAREALGTLYIDDKVKYETTKTVRLLDCG